MAFGNLGFPNKHGRGNSVFWQQGGNLVSVWGWGARCVALDRFCSQLTVGISWERSLGFLAGKGMSVEVTILMESNLQE